MHIEKGLMTSSMQSMIVNVRLLLPVVWSGIDYWCVTAKPRHGTRILIDVLISVRDLSRLRIVETSTMNSQIVSQIVMNIYLIESSWICPILRIVADVNERVNTTSK